MQNSQIAQLDKDEKDDDDYKDENNREDDCRICRGVCSEFGQLISPCYCKGSVGLVHIQCLQRWLKSSSRLNCEICNYHFRTRFCRRHTFFEGIHIWLKNPLRRQRLKTDIYSLLLLTVILLLIIFICALKMDQTFKELPRIDHTWTVTLLSLFLTVVSACYIWAIFYVVIRQVAPWFGWWKSARRVQLELFDLSSQTSNNPNDANSGTPIVTEPMQIVLR